MLFNTYSGCVWIMTDGRQSLFLRRVGLGSQQCFNNNNNNNNNNTQTRQADEAFTNYFVMNGLYRMHCIMLSTIIDLF